MFRSVAIVSRTDKSEALELVQQINRHLEKKGVSVKLEKELAEKLNCSEKKTTDFKVDLLITIGGDGTVLRAFHITNGLVPILPIRMGTVGFLCDQDWSQALDTIDSVLGGNYSEDVCFSLKSDLKTPLAMNEFRVGCPLPSHPIEIEVYVDKFLIAKDKLDAIIVSTNTGASAYALSAGANIVDPRLHAIMIVPICPLSTNFKPYIVPSESIITIRVIDDGDLMILVDGEYQKRLSELKEIKISKSPNKVTFLRTGPTFYDRLKRRLNISSTR